MPSTRRLNKNQFQPTIFFYFSLITTCYHCLPSITTRYHCLPPITIGFPTHYHSLPLVSPPITIGYPSITTYYHQFHLLVVTTNNTRAIFEPCDIVRKKFITGKTLKLTKFITNFLIVLKVPLGKTLEYFV